MSTTARTLLAVVVVCIVAALALIASSANTEQTGSIPVWQSSRQCKDCHASEYREWLGSHHQIAYTNPAVRELSDDFRNKECQACHLPRPVFVTGVTERTLPRLTRPDEGVDCLACHLSDSGDILARHTRPDAPCRPRASDDLISVRLCETCHNQHGTTDQWRDSGYPERAITCNECHMQRRDGAGRGHVFPGAHDLEMLRSAAQFTVVQEGDRVRLRLNNTGAGHNFPTEERHRAVDIEYRFLRGQETPPAFIPAYRFRQPYRDEAGENTQLPATHSHDVRLSIPAGASALEARLLYRLTPYESDGDSAVLFDRRLELR